LTVRSADRDVANAVRRPVEAVVIIDIGEHRLSGVVSNALTATSIFWAIAAGSLVCE